MNTRTADILKSRFEREERDAQRLLQEVLRRGVAIKRRQAILLQRREGTRTTLAVASGALVDTRLHSFGVQQVERIELEMAETSFELERFHLERLHAMSRWKQTRERREWIETWKKNHEEQAEREVDRKEEMEEEGD